MAVLALAKEALTKKPYRACIQPLCHLSAWVAYFILIDLLFPDFFWRLFILFRVEMAVAFLFSVKTAKIRAFLEC